MRVTGNTYRRSVRGRSSDDLVIGTHLGMGTEKFQIASLINNAAKSPPSHSPHGYHPKLLRFAGVAALFAFASILNIIYAFPCSFFFSLLAQRPPEHSESIPYEEKKKKKVSSCKKQSLKSFVQAAYYVLQLRFKIKLPSSGGAPEACNGGGLVWTLNILYVTSLFVKLRNRTLGYRQKPGFRQRRLVLETPPYEVVLNGWNKRLAWHSSRRTSAYKQSIRSSGS